MIYKTTNKTTISNNLVAPTKQIIFIDSQVEDYQSLATGVVPGVEIIILERNSDGIKQITAVLSQKVNLTSIHIVSHGSPGCLYLGNTQLSLDTIDEYAEKLRSWFDPPTLSRTPLNKGGRGDLLIYGCNVAAGDAGEEFIAKLHDITGAEIAASATRTGNAAQGGDWNLEVTTNKLDASALAFQSNVLAAYSGVLAIDIDGPTTEWSAIEASGVNAYDFSTDQQTGQTEGDIVGNNNDHLFYMQFDGIDDTSTTDGTLAFRVRVGQDKNLDGAFSSNLFVGIDADGSGSVDIFVGVHNQGSNSDVAIWNVDVEVPADPLDNTSPSTTIITSPPVYEVVQSATNYDFSLVDNTIDPGVANTDINADGGTDAFVSFSLDFAQLVTQLGNLGFTVDETTPINFVLGTATQDNSLNQDIGGINDKTADQSLTWTDSGAISNTLQFDGATPGNEYSETLTGTTDNDIISGYEGQDTLTGNGGDDVFVYTQTSDGIDIITDFDATSGDRLDLSDIANGELSGVTITNNLFDDGYIDAIDFELSGTKNTMIQIDFDITGLNNKNLVYLEGVDSNDIDVTDFIF